MGSTKKHKKHKSERREKHDGGGSDHDKLQQGLKLILKVGSQNSPEHESEIILGENGDPMDPAARVHHKKSKKKKKKKDKSKDKDRKHKHHHKDKKRKREESMEDEEKDPLGTANDNVSVISDEQLVLDEVLNSIDLGSPSSSVFREPRTCVIKKAQEKTLVQRMLEQVHRALEKRDPQNFFAWPVTDNIAPGYSSIITNPMDLSSMKQKVDENEYADLNEFMDDFRLMCENAMKYNHADTVYYKASRKLLHAGLKLLIPEKIGWLLVLIPEVTSKELGFEIPADVRAEHPTIPSYSPIKRLMPATKFEAIPDDMEPAEIAAQVREAARRAHDRLLERQTQRSAGGGKLASANGGAGGKSPASSSDTGTVPTEKKPPCAAGPSMGFLRQGKDGTTHLTVLVGGDGVVAGTRKRPVLLGQLTGKLSEGTGQMQGFREDRRNLAKPVKPLHYGAFGSYAPSYDSAFANLTREESELVLQTYGSESAMQYAESIMDFSKECDYTVWMVDSLLDLLTGGEHSNTKSTLTENKKLRDEELAVQTVLDDSRRHSASVPPEDVDIDVLRTLADEGIDVSFLDRYQEAAQLQRRLDAMGQLLDRLQRVQHKRLSQPLPPHLSLIQGPGDEELQLAQTVTDHLADIARHMQPSDITSVSGVRRAMGVVGPEPPDPLQGLSSASGAGTVGTSEVDLESELRQFLESAPNQTVGAGEDKTIEEILME